MSDETTVELDTKNLDRLTRALKKRVAQIRVGILKGGKRTDGLTNAEVGAFHEFGTSTIPKRSFLKTPISENLPSRLDSSGAFDSATLQEVASTQSVIPWLRKIAVIAEGIVADAFASNGFGKWVPSNMANKENHQTLVETGQLRDSVTSEIKE